MRDLPHSAYADATIMNRPRAVRRQFDPTGAIILRRRPQRGGIMQSLLFACVPCPDRDCACRTVTLSGILIDGELAEARLEDGKFATK